MAKAYLIDAVKQEIRELEFTGEESLPDEFGGNLDLAAVLPNRDSLYASENGMREETLHFFVLRSLYQGGGLYFAGNALLLGHEDKDQWRDVTTTIEELRQEIRFLSLDQLAAMLKGGDSSIP